MKVLDNDHSVCSRCEDNCCRLSGNADAVRAALSLSDLARIQEYTGRNWASFAELRAAPPAEKLEILRRAFPELATLYVGKSHASLRFDGDDCVLLEDGRCSLPRDVRPRFCALFPLWIRVDGDEIEVTAGEVSAARRCEAIEQAGRDVRSVLPLFGLGESELESLVRLTLAEIREHATACKEVPIWTWQS